MTDFSEGFDACALIEDVKAQAPECAWLPEALKNAGQGVWRSRAYVHYVSSKNANKPGAEWQHEKSIMLSHKTLGTIVIDVLTGNRLGGIEFVDKID